MFIGKARYFRNIQPPNVLFTWTLGSRVNVLLLSSLLLTLTYTSHSLVSIILHNICTNWLNFIHLGHILLDFQSKILFFHCIHFLHNFYQLFGGSGLTNNFKKHIYRYSNPDYGTQNVYLDSLCKKKKKKRKEIYLCNWLNEKNVFGWLGLSLWSAAVKPGQVFYGQVPLKSKFWWHFLRVFY